jgi:hypothetical protein
VDNQPKIICNVNVISEGANLVLTDSIVFAERRNSPIGIIQNIGRALRTHPTKDFAMIVMPKHMDNSMTVINALRMQDSRVTHKQMLIGKTSNIIVNNLLTKLYNKCNLLEIDRKGGMWLHKYNLCIKWETINENKFIERKIIVDGYSVGSWFHAQFKKFIDDDLPADHVEKLKLLRSWKHASIKRAKTTLDETILYVMRNGRRYNYKTICAEITRLEIYDFGDSKTPANTCNRQLHLLHKQGRIIQIPDMTPDTFQLKQQMKTIEFVDNLKELKIFSDIDYRYKFSPDFDTPYVENPTEFYRGFTWNKVLSDKKFLAIDEAKKEIGALLDDEKIQTELKKIRLCSKKYQYLRRLNSLLPPDPLTYYNIKKYNELDKRLYERIIHELE